MRLPGLRLPAGFICLLLVSALPGCAGKKTGTVQGSVSIDGTPITFGTVTFQGTDGHVDSGMIDEEGRYKISKAPAGEVAITVQTYPLPPMVRPPDLKGEDSKGPTTKAKYVPVPAHYADAKLTPLRFKVEAGGTQSHDLTLTRKGR